MSQFCLCSMIFWIGYLYYYCRYYHCCCYCWHYCFVFVVGKISRLVSLIYHPEPEEIQKPNSNNLRHFQNSRGLSLTNSSRQFSTQSSMLRSSQLTSGHPASTHISRQRSSLSEIGEPSTTPKRRRVHGSPGSMEHFSQDSGRGHSAVTSSGVGRSHHHKSKKMKKVKNEE